LQNIRVGSFTALFIIFSIVEIRAQNLEKLSEFSLDIFVRDSLSHLPLEDATVQLSKNGNKTSLTDFKGGVKFENISQGNYVISCTYVGYHVYINELKINSNQKLFIDLCPVSFHLHEAKIETERLVNKNNLRAHEQMNLIALDKSRNGNLTDIISSIKGISSINTGPALAKPVIRGLHSNRIVLINNNVKQEEQQWGAEHAPGIDPFMLGSIEIIKGSSSLEYGHEAIGGVIKVNPREFRKIGGVEAALSSQYLSNNKQYVGYAMVQGTSSKKITLSWRLEASNKIAGDSKAPNYNISNTGFEEQNLMASLNIKTKKLNFEMYNSYFSEKVGIMRAAHIGNSSDLIKAIQSDKPLFIYDFTYNIGRPYQLVNHFLNSSKFRFLLSEKTELVIQLGAQQNIRSEYDLGVSWNQQSLAAQKPAYFLTLNTLSSDLILSHHFSNSIQCKSGFNFSNQSNITSGIQKPIIPNFIGYNFGPFLTANIKYNKFQLDAGLRMDYSSIETFSRNQNNEIVNRLRTFNDFAASMGATYYLNENFSLGSSISKSWRPPSVNELYSNGLHNGVASYEMGDSSLRSEQSYNLNVDLEYTNKYFNTQLSLFNNLINQFIYQSPLANPVQTLRGVFPTFMFHQDDIIMRGAEISAEVNLNKNSKAGGSFSYLLATLTETNQPLIYMPPTNVKVFYKLNKKEFGYVSYPYLEFSCQLVAKQNRFPDGVDYKEPPAGYSLFDINSGFQKRYLGILFNFNFSVKNIFNQTYRSYLNRFRYFSDEAGRNFIIRLSVNFNQKSANTE